MNPERFFSFHMNSDLDGGEFSAQTKAQELFFFFLSLSLFFLSGNKPASAWNRNIHTSDLKCIANERSVWEMQ